MNKKVQPNFLTRLAKNVRKLTAGFQEKPEVTIDNYVLEHFLLYNGLIGSSPENQPLYKDVRNDIVDAVNRESPAKMAIALKLSPLWWQDRLEKIFSEIASINKPGAINCLLAEQDVFHDTVGDSTPLSHTNWQVRANAARILAFLDVKEATPRLLKLLKETQDEHKSAFCHYAYSLASLGSEQARQGLCEELSNDEAWFRVDAAGALAHWPLPSVARDLSEALLSGSPLDDYMAVAISRKHNLIELAEFQDEEVKEAFAEMALALHRGLTGPLHSEHQAAQQLRNAAQQINDLAHEQPSPRRLRSAICINEWVNSPLPKNAIRDLSQKAHYESVKQTVETGNTSTEKDLTQLKHALYLSGRFKLNELAPHLTPLLNTDFPALPALLDCVSELGTSSDAPHIAKIIQERVDLNSRSLLALSAHPVVESDEETSLVYWCALKALGAMPHPAAVEILAKAVNDYAPDKREQALLSLQKICLSESVQSEFKGDLKELVKERLSDPSSSVQKAALTGVALHRMNDLLPEVMKSLQSRESSLQRQSADTICVLSQGANKDNVRQALEAGIKKEIDASKKNRMQDVLDRIS
ncbi:MAG: HEAT repeat domain-containing protein [Candidatus Obscuribacterales bacterium]|jgi:HEAT repeat protein|nr:HEAT repeat domain-containing protein [Candidatus Obscuribacterales bacterium]